MAAGRYDFEIEQSAKLYKVLTWQDSTGAAVPLTGYSARMQIRESFEDDDLENPVLLELTTANGRIVLEDGAVEGQIELKVGADITEAITWTAAVHDLIIINDADPTDVTRLVQGRVRVSPDVTKRT